MSNRPNFYQLLDLDPAVDDWRTIEARIQEKKRVWSKNRTSGSPKQRREAARAFDLLQEMERTLQEPETRAAEAKAEKQRRQAEIREREKELDESIDVLKAAGTCREEDVEKLVRRFQKTFPEAHVRQKLRAAGVTAEAKTRRKRSFPSARIDDAIARTVRQNLDQTGHADLYAFLGLRPQSSPEALVEKAAEIYRENQRRGKTDAKASAENVLAGQAKQIFRDGTEKARYDAYLAVEAMEALKPNIVLAAQDGYLNRQELDVLVRQARERGVSAENARAYLEQYAEEQGVGIERDADLPAETLRQCGFCGHLVSGGQAKSCTKCGEPLEVECPRCGISNPSENAACQSCGARVGDAPIVLGHLKEARRLLSSGRLPEARARLHQALHHWPDWKPAAEVLKDVEARIEQREARIEAVAEKVRMHRMRAARAELERLERELGGDGLDALRQRIETDMAEAEAAFRQGEAYRRVGRMDDALDHLEKALGLCADHEEARKVMASSPPPPPEALTVRSSGEGFRLAWEPGSRRGSLHYRVVRKVGSTPRNETDGETVGEVGEPLLDDSPVPVGTVVHYAVFALRGGVPSASGVRSGPHLRTAEVEDLTASAGDGEVTLSFQPPPGCLRVEAWCEAGRPPAHAGAGRRLSVSGNTARDSRLENGRRYGYRVMVVFADPEQPGGEIRTSGVTLEAVPVAPPEPVRDLEAERRGNSVLLTWSPVPQAAVEIRWSLNPPPFHPGEVLSIAHAERFGQRVAATGSGSARLELTAQGRLHFVPLTVREGTMVPGEPCEVVTLDPVRDLQVRRSGRSLLLTWAWPEGGKEVLVRHGHDRAPQDPEAGDAVSLHVSRAAYERNGGFLLSPAEERAYHFAVFARAAQDDLYSSPASVTVSLGRKASVAYQVHVRRHWLRRHVQDAWVELVSQNGSLPPLPALRLVGKPRNVPVHPADGMPLHRVDSVDFQDGRARIQIPERHWRSELYCKLFFEDPEAAADVRLIPAARERLRLA